MLENIIDFIPAIFGFAIGLLWLAQRLGIIAKIRQQIIKIDNQTIVLPALSIIVLPFLFTHLWNLLFTIKSGDLNSKSWEFLLDTTRALFPVLAFILGRYFNLLDKSENILEIKESVFYELYNNLDNIDAVTRLANLPGFNPLGFDFFEKLEKGLWSDKAYVDNIKIIHKITPSAPLLIHDIYKFYKSLILQKNLGNKILIDYLALDLIPKVKQAMSKIDKDKAEILLSDMEQAGFKSLFNINEQDLEVF